MTKLEVFYEPPKDSIKKRNKIYLSISIAILLFYHVIEFYFGDKMFNHSIEISKTLQKIHIENFSFFISHIFYYTLYIYVLIMPFIRQKNEKLFLYVIEIFFSVYFANMLKNIYRILRPSLLSIDLREDGSFCENTYGQPSGHTQVVFTLILVIHCDLSRNMKCLKKISLFFCTIIFAFLVSFTRVYFGVHSYNQVFMGIIWAAVTFLFFETFQEFFCKHFIIPMICRSHFPKKRISAFIYFTGCFLFFVLILFVSYFVSIAQESDEYFSKIINCKNVLENLPNFSERSLGTSSVIIFIYFYFLGIFFYPKNFKTFSVFYFDKKILKFMVRIIFHLIIILLMVLHRVPKINQGKYKIFNIIRSFFIHSILGFVSTYGNYIFFKYLKIGYNSKDLKNKVSIKKSSDDEFLSKEVDDKNLENQIIGMKIDQDNTIDKDEEKKD